MLPRRQRIRRGEEFREVIRAGSRAATSTVVVHLAVLVDGSGTDVGSGGAVPARVGFVVGKSVGGSVERHRVTRRLRHLMSVRLDALPSGAAVVVRALPAAAQCDSATLGVDLDSALRRCVAKLGHDRGTRVRVPL